MGKKTEFLQKELKRKKQKGSWKKIGRTRKILEKIRKLQEKIKLQKKLANLVELETSSKSFKTSSHLRDLRNFEILAFEGIIKIKE